MRRLQQGNANGIISVVVTMILMLVISLMVLGFAQISRREQRASLDRQLSTQAFLAAESGVNDARSAVLAKMAVGSDVPEKTDCKQDANYPAGMTINSANDVSYTCLLISTKMKTLSVNPLSAGSSAQTMILESDGGAVNDVTLVWKSLQPIANQARINGDCKLNGGNTLPGASDWKCPYGLLRADIVPADTFNRTAMVANTRTMLVYPVGTGGNTNASYAGANGAILPTACDPTSCRLTITNLTGASRYALRLQSVYADGAVDISATAAGGGSLELKNAQIQIDATGKAQDVLRRIQVRLPYTTTNNAPDYALQSGSSICKRFAITDDSFVIPNDIEGQDLNNPMCKTMSVIPPGTVNPATGCTVLDLPNFIRNGTFSISAGQGPGTSPAAGFQSDLPNRGPNVYPDDYGLVGGTQGWKGGYSVQDTSSTGTAQYNPGGTGTPVYGKSFPGDAPRAVPPSGTWFYSNPYQRASSPKGTDETFVGTIWRQQVTGLQADTWYDFTAYFDNLLPTNATDQDPIVELRANNVQVMAPRAITKSPDQWVRASIAYKTRPGETSVNLEIFDSAGTRYGDDLGMTALALRRCIL